MSDTASQTVDLNQLRYATLRNQARGQALPAGREDKVLASVAFLCEHWTCISSTNPLERVNREVKRRTDVVGIFPDEAAVLQLVGALLLETDDE